MIPWVKPSVLVASSGIDSFLKALTSAEGLRGLKHLSLKPCDRDSILAGLSSIVREHRLHLIALARRGEYRLLCDLCGRLPKEQLLHVFVGAPWFHELLDLLGGACLDRVRGFIIAASSTNEVVRAFSIFERLRARGLLSKRLYLVLVGLGSVSYNEDILDYVARMCCNYGADLILVNTPSNYLEAWGFRGCGRSVHALGLTVEEYVKGTSKVYVANGVDTDNLMGFSIDEVKLVISPKWVSGVSVESPIPTCSYKLRMIDGILRRMLESSNLFAVRIVPCLMLMRGEARAIIDESIIKFLKAVRDKGSLKGASESLHAPLTTMRKRIVSIEEIIGVKLVETRKGGVERGGTKLTKDALRLIKAFDAMKECFTSRFKDGTAS